VSQIGKACCRGGEKKLKDYPNAVPLLTELMAAYKITGEDDKLLGVMRRLRREDGRHGMRR
jgi:hypothetical protein